jgi:hypothetical protein
LRGAMERDFMDAHSAAIDGDSREVPVGACRDVTLRQFIAALRGSIMKQASPRPEAVIETVLVALWLAGEDSVLQFSQAELAAQLKVTRASFSKKARALAHEWRKVVHVAGVQSDEKVAKCRESRRRVLERKSGAAA